MDKTLSARFTDRLRVLLLGALVASGVMAAQPGAAGELMYGCMTRPACGKVCKLVCETKTLTVTCYGCECEQICIPGPSQAGCKHCSTNCCNGVCGRGYDCGYNDLGCDIVDCCGSCGCGCGCDDGCCNHAPKCEFCWRDWCACGCARPRTVKKLTKYEAQKEICWYHWEVVDSCCCGCCCGCDDARGCADGCDCVYKEAPAAAKIGDTFELSAEEQAEIASRVDTAIHVAQALASASNTPQHIASTSDAAAFPQAEKTSLDENQEPETSKLKGISSLFQISEND